MNRTDHEREATGQEPDDRNRAADVRAARAEAMLVEANVRLELALAAGEIGTWRLDAIRDHVVADINLARMFGMSAEEAAGAPIAVYARAIHPEDRPRVESLIAGSLASHTSYETEYRLVRPDGTVRWVLARGHVQRNDKGEAIALPGVVLDITQRVQAEQERQAMAQAIERQARIFDTTLSSITDFAYIFDREGRFAYVNQPLLDLWGLTLHEAVGKNFFDLHYPADLAVKLQRQIQQVFDTGKNLTDETPYTSTTGAGGYYEYIFTPVRGADGAVEVVAGSTRDITARKRTEQQLERALDEQRALQEKNVQLLTAERAARSAAERANHLKDEFLATLSHELRTPLNAILGWSQILSRTDHPPKVAHALEIIERNAHLQRKLIEDLLDMSRIDAGKVLLHVQNVHLGEIVAAAVAALQPAGEAKGVQIDTLLDCALPIFLGDGSRLQQVVWNLLSNAIKFTPPSGRITIALACAGSLIELSVADTGSGMDPAFLPYAFERFSQSDASITRQHGGLGLGLAIVKKIVELHGGTVEAQSEGIDKGARFIVRLARTVAAPHESAPVLESGSRTDDNPDLLRGIRVLVVEDERDGRMMIGRILEDYSATVALTGSAAEALKVVEAFQPNVIISDIGMPQIDGYEFMRTVRQLGGAVSIVSSIALTALARPEDRTHALLAGYQSHIGKPVDALELVATVAALAGRSSSASPRRSP